MCPIFGYGEDLWHQELPNYESNEMLYICEKFSEVHKLGSLILRNSRQGCIQVIWKKKQLPISVKATNRTNAEVLLRKVLQHTEVSNSQKRLKFTEQKLKHSSEKLRTNCLTLRHINVN